MTIEKSALAGRDENASVMHPVSKGMRQLTSSRFQSQTNGIPK